MPKTASRLTKLALLLALVAAGWWGLRWFRERPRGGSSGLSWFGSGKSLWIERSGPGGVRYAVDAGPAAFRLDMLPEDEPSQLVFTSYGAALRYAHEHRLPSMPSASLVLAGCSASDCRMQAALEMALDGDPQTGRSVLLRRWLDTVVRSRKQAPPSALAAYDGAATYLAAAILLGGDALSLPDDLKRLAAGAAGAANDPPLGPWATTPALAAIWRRDRFLARGISVRDTAGAALAAVLARTMTADGALAAGWQWQLAVSRALHGRESGATFELLASRLAGVPDAEIAGAAAVACVRSAVASGGSVDEGGIAVPAALAWVMTPEEEVLKPLQMAAWEDPLGSLVRAIRGGEVSLEPGPDAGFYRQRWFALETLAAPAKAPEAIKLQLSADYERRWQRAFAAGFTEGRAGFVKRLPIITMGCKADDDIPVEVAPQFSAEPAPVVYLRLARAYRALERDLSAAMGADPWRQLRDADGKPLAADLRQRTEILYGLAGKVYREIGFPPLLLDDEAAMDFTAAEAAADAWCASLETNPEVGLDARVLVTLASDDRGAQKCPAVLGVRLEPVEYSWVEEPDVSGEVTPKFVAARYWLASPIPATLTLSNIPTPAEFRQRCDGHSSVRDVYAAFGQSPPPLHTPGRRWWAWAAAGLVLLGSGLAVTRWWRKRTKRCRRFVMAGMAAGLAGALACAVLAPPLWLLRLAWVHVVEPHASLGSRSGEWFIKWAGRRQVVLAMELLQDCDPQMRYCGAMMAWSDVRNGAYTAAQLAVLRSRIHDEVPEVGWAAWSELCTREDEVAFLVSELPRCNEPADLRLRLDWLGSGRRSRADVVEGVLKLATDPRPAIRAAVMPSLARWSPEVPAMAEAVRAATHDADASVREQAVMALGDPRDAAGLAGLLDMLNDPAACVRVSAFRMVSQHIGRSTSRRNPSATAPHWTEEAVQKSLVPYARNPAVTVDERVSAARWIADPATLRASCRELLAGAQKLPERVVRDGALHLTRREALAALATRWVLADEYAQLTVKYPRENSYGLDQHPELVSLLNRRIAEDRSAENTLEALREALKQSGIVEESGNRQTAAELMISLSCASKTPGRR